MSEVMLQLGPYQFGIDTAAYSSLRHSMSVNWASQPRLSANDALQMTGYGRETIELRGVVHAEFRGGLDQPGRMRDLAGLGIPLPLISGRGDVMGLWVIDEVSEGQSIFAAQGAPLRQEFELRLRRYDGGVKTILRGL